MNARQRAAARELYRRDFPLFAEEQLKIKTIHPGEVLPLRFNMGQQMLHDKMERQKKKLGYIRAVLLKGRQLGGSTYSQARVFHDTIFTPNFSTLLIAVDEASTSKIFNISRDFFDFMDDDLRPMNRLSNKKELVFENPNARLRGTNPGLKSRMDFQQSTQIMAGTGTTRHALHLSEVAKFHPDDVKLLVASLMPSIHLVPGTTIIEESTAYVGGDHFRQMCEQARSGESEEIFCFVPWWLDTKNSIPLQRGEKIQLDSEEKLLQRLAERGQEKDDVPPHTITPEQFKWRRVRLSKYQNIDAEQLFEQEYPRDPDSAWVNLDIAVFPWRILDEMRVECRPPRRIVEMEHVGDGSYRIVTVKAEGHAQVFADREYIAIWEEPQPGVIYDIGADVGAGIKGGDWSVAQVIRRDTHEQVAEFHKYVDVKDYGDELYWLGKFYNTAQIGVEMNGAGIATGQQLASRMYPYIYRWRHREREVMTFSSYAGWKTQRDSKHMMVSTARHLVNHRKLTIHSRVLWDEMHDFVRLGDQEYRGGMGHDDSVMALCICIQIGEDESTGIPRTPEPEPEAWLMPHERDGFDLKGPKKDHVAVDLARELRDE